MGGSLGLQSVFVGGRPSRVSSAPGTHTFNFFKPEVHSI